MIVRLIWWYPLKLEQNASRMLRMKTCFLSQTFSWASALLDPEPFWRCWKASPPEAPLFGVVGVVVACVSEYQIRCWMTWCQLLNVPQM